MYYPPINQLSIKELRIFCKKITNFLKNVFSETFVILQKDKLRILR